MLKNKVFGLLVVGLVLTGGGCASFLKPNDSISDESKVNWQVYENQEYGFGFEYPPSLEVQSKSVENAATGSYAGFSGRIVASIRNIARSDEPETIAFVYHFEDATVRKLKEGIVGIDSENVEIIDEVFVNRNGLKLTRIESTTALGDNKVNYVMNAEKGIIVFSVFLTEVEDFDRFFETAYAL